MRQTTALRLLSRRTKARARDILLRPDYGFRSYLRLRCGVLSPRGRPIARWQNAPLTSRDEWLAAARMVRELGLVPHPDEPKNWDTMSALATILSHTTSTARILDAGAEVSSSLLPCLYMYGYRSLVGINLVFEKPQYRGSIVYEHGDITRTTFPSAHFDAIACLSVIEHGVDIAAYFHEVSRILRPGGLLITSTDYYPSPIDPRGAIAYGTPVRIFSRHEIRNLVEEAQRSGLSLTGPLELNCTEKPIRWERVDLDFTFLVLTMRKTSNPGNA